MNPLHATIEEFAADGYTHVQCYCPRCRAMRLRPINCLPRISKGLTIAELSVRLRCLECGGQVHLVKPWRLDDARSQYRTKACREACIRRGLSVGSDLTEGPRTLKTKFRFYPRRRRFCQ